MTYKSFPLIILIFCNIYRSSMCNINHEAALEKYFKKDYKSNTTINYCSYIYDNINIFNKQNNNLNLCLNKQYVNNYLYTKVIELRKMKKKIKSFISTLNIKILKKFPNNLNLNGIFCSGILLKFNKNYKIKRIIKLLNDKIDKFWDVLTIYHFNISCNINLKKTNYVSINNSDVAFIFLNPKEVKNIMNNYNNIINIFFSLHNFFNCAITSKLNYKKLIFDMNIIQKNVSENQYLKFIDYPNNFNWFNNLVKVYEIYQLVIEKKEVNILKEIRNKKLKYLLNIKNKKLKSELKIKHFFIENYHTSYDGNSKIYIYNNKIKNLITKKGIIDIFNYIFIYIIIILN